MTVCAHSGNQRPRYHQICSAAPLTLPGGQKSTQVGFEPYRAVLIAQDHDHWSSSGVDMLSPQNWPAAAAPPHVGAGPIN